MEWEKLNWPVLDRLRAGFLSGDAAKGPYWKSHDDLRHYEVTYGERIGWKWDAVLAELHRRGWAPPRGPILDWGCGSGIAGRRVITSYGREHFTTLHLWDHARVACEYSVDAARRHFPNLPVQPYEPGQSPGLLVLSHVLNELSPAARQELLALAEKADAVLWVEPGTPVISRDLIRFREQLKATFRVVAPCTHQAVCGLLAPGNDRHWCHYFAAPPAAIYADSDWVKFGQRAGIDLRSLPYSFLVLEKSAEPVSPRLPQEAARVVGEPRLYKGFAKLLSCAHEGVSELTLQKRDAPELFKQLKKTPAVPIYQWERVGERVTHGVHIFPPPKPPPKEETLDPASDA